MFEVAHLPYFVAVLFSALTVSVELSLFVCLLIDLFCLFLRQSTMHIPICLAVFWVVYASLLTSVTQMLGYRYESLCAAYNDFEL